MSGLFDLPSEGRPKPCAWCGEGTFGTLEVDKPKYGKAANGSRIIRRAAILAPCCARCAMRMAPSETESKSIA